MYVGQNINQILKAKTIEEHEVYGLLKYNRAGDRFYINPTKETVTYAYEDVTSENYNYDLEDNVDQDEAAWRYDTYTFEEWKNQ